MSAAQVFLRKEIWMGMLNLFMKERGHSNVVFVMQLFLEKIVWAGISYQFMKKKRPKNVTFVTLSLLANKPEKTHCLYS